MNDDARREVAIFIEAIKIPLLDRSTYLDIACSGDENLRQKVEALLESHDRIGNFLEASPLHASSELNTLTTCAKPPLGRMSRGAKATNILMAHDTPTGYSPLALG